MGCTCTAHDLPPSTHHSPRGHLPAQPLQCPALPLSAPGRCCLLPGRNLQPESSSHPLAEYFLPATAEEVSGVSFAGTLGHLLR